MSNLPWFRMYHEARTDAKLRSLPDDEFRVWFNLLCMAAEQDEGRGSIDFSDPFILAVECAGGDEELLSRACHALSRLKIVTCDGVTLTFVNFPERQYDKPSDRPESTRTRKQRSRAKAQQSSQESDMSRDVTPGHALDTDTDTEIKDANASKRAPNYPPAFLAFWAQYPKGHGSRKAAAAQWQRLKPDDALVEEIMAGLAAWQQSERWSRDFVVAAERWIRDRLWENPAPPATAAGGRRADGYAHIP
mgnify:CR=1 FL=1